MTYFILLISTIIIIYIIGDFINIPTVQNSIFKFFIQQISVLTFCISIFSIYITSFKTIYILFLPLYIYLFKNNYFILNKNIKNTIFKNWKYLLISLPIILIQFILYYDFINLDVYELSNDIHAYAAIAYNLIHYKQENTFAFLNELYPKLFNGIGVYHYYEIWFTSIIGFVTGKSFSLILQLVVPNFQF